MLLLLLRCLCFYAVAAAIADLARTPRAIALLPYQHSQLYSTGYAMLLPCLPLPAAYERYYAR